MSDPRLSDYFEPEVRRCIWCRCPETACVCFELDELREQRDDDERRQQEQELQFHQWQQSLDDLEQQLENERGY